MRNSHPIKVPVVDALDIDQLFDAISYLKGSSAILMLSTYLGTDVFLAGVARYLNTHKNANTSADDLWAAIAAVSGRGVGYMMDAWISRIGLPVVRVTRFLNGGDLRPDEDATVWQIPLNVRTAGAMPVLDVLLQKSATVSLPDGFLKLNADTQAPYRVDYDAHTLHTNVLLKFGLLSARDRVGVIADVFSMAVSGAASTSTVTFLQLSKRLVVDGDLLQDAYAPWKELEAALASFCSTFRGTDTALTERVCRFATTTHAALTA